MAVTYNIKGTTNSSFKVGKQGTGTVYTGVITNTIQDSDLTFQGNDGGSTITALTLDMSDGGTAIFNKDIKIGDSKNIEIGASGDLRLYHDGSNSYIDDVGTGSIIARGSSINIQSDNLSLKKYDGTESYLVCTGDGAVELRHDNTKVIETVAGGVTVSGNATVTGNLLVQGTTTTINATTIDVKNAFRFEGATADDFETILTVEDPTADRTVTIPDATTTLVGTDTTQTLTNKTITDAVSISIANTTTSDSLLLTTTEDSSTAGPVLTLKRNSASPDDADYLGQIKFKGENDADQETVYAKITGKILDATDGSEDGMLEYAFIKAGSQNISGRFRSDQFQLLNGTSLYVGAGGQISFEGSTSNAYETTIAVTDPTADRTITLPDDTGIIVTKDSATGMMNLPVGTTAQRPGSPVTGSMRFNSTTKRFEGYNGIQWVAMSPYPDDITTPRDGDPVQLEPGDLGSLT